MVDQKRGKNEPVPPEDARLADPLRVDSGAPDTHETRTATRLTEWPPGGSIDVNLHGTAITPTNVQALWELILRETEAISFKNYADFIDTVVCGSGSQDTSRPRRLHDAIERVSPFGLDTYQLLRTATEAFLIARCGFLPPGFSDPGHLDQNNSPTPSSKPELKLDATRYGGTVPPSIADVLKAYKDGHSSIPYIESIIRGLDTTTESRIADVGISERLLRPCFLELIWSYWHEEGLLVQAINTVSLRFQNKRGPAEREPLANLETNPLRPLSNLLWGYIQDEDHRLTIPRRAYEYEHEYGLSLVGKAVPRLRPADRRSKFLEAFHALLHETAIFFERSSNLTIRADGFPLLNALREVHLLLAEGAHNQFRDLPWTARAEMLIQQWLLSRREMREFLGGRASVPYTEEWMGPVDAIKRLMGWNDTPVTHFHDLATTGERILLSIRYHAWNDATNEAEATGWATYWKPEIQRYIHAYQAATGVDLGALKDSPSTRRINATLPSLLLQQRNARQNGR
ncbi:MAG: hypothetical protein JWO56_2322 [Acidobacteria bacterium]|nr:hypothetical protein [Acidobacteriota bacterium]